MADTRDLKSLVKYLTYGFESRLRHQTPLNRLFAARWAYFRRREMIYLPKKVLIVVCFGVFKIPH